MTTVGGGGGWGGGFGSGSPVDNVGKHALDMREHKMTLQQLFLQDGISNSGPAVRRHKRN